MREPFQMPSGCPAVAVNVDILGDLPFCSVPSFPDPVFAPRLPPVVIPDIAPPDACLCISVDVDMSMHVVPGLQCGVTGNFAKISRDADCCDGLYNLSLALDVPCMPFSVYVSHNITMSAIADPTMHVALTRRATIEDQCDLGLQLSIDVPCIGFEMVGSAYVAYGDVSGPQANLKVSRNANDCDIGLRLSLLLPDFVLDPLDIPCMPFTVAVSQNITMSAIAEPAMHLALNRQTTPSGECGLGIQLSIDVPCIGFNMAGSAYVDYGMVTMPQINLTVSRNVANCDIGLRLSLLLPDFAIVLGDAPCFVGDADVPGTQYKSIKVYGT